MGRRTWLALGIAVVVAVTAGVLVVAVAGGDDDLPAPPDGSRWVGMDGVVVAVPEWWTTGETDCEAPVEDTVYFDPSATLECAEGADTASVDEVSALAVLDSSSGYGELQRRDMEPVPGSPGVVERDGCEQWFPGVCRLLFALEGHDVVFAVTVGDPRDADYEDIRDSVRVLPDGLTTVPLHGAMDHTPSWGDEPAAVDDLVAAIEGAGLAAEVVTAERRERGDTGDVASLPPGSLLEVEPSPGSVVDDGDTVTITVMY